MNKAIVAGLVALFLSLSPALVWAQTNGSSEDSLFVALTQLIQVLEQELQQLLALHGGGQNVNFTASPTSGQAPLAVQFQSNTSGMIRFGDGQASGLAFNDAVYATQHIYASPGTYTATLEDSSGNSLGTVTITVTGTQSANFTASPTSGQAPLAVQFQSNTSGMIRFGDGQASGLAFNDAVYATQHIYASPGTYTATLEDSSGNSLGTVTITVTGTQSANFTASPTSGQAPLAVQFQSNTSGMIRFGDGQASGLAFNDAVYATQHIYASPGTYTATLEDSSGNSLGTVTITVTGTQSANFTASPTSGQAPLAVQFQSNTSGMIRFGDGQASGLAFNDAVYATQHIYASPGTYTATLEDSSGNSLGTVTITVTGTQSANFTASPTSGQAPLAVVFSAIAGQNLEGNNTISFGDGETGALHPSSCNGSTCTYAIAYTYTSPGTYTATLLSSSGVTLGSATIFVASGINTVMTTDAATTAQ